MDETIVEESILNTCESGIRLERMTFAGFVCLLTFLSGPACTSKPSHGRTAAQWKELIGARKQAAVRGDTSTWSNFVPEDVVWIGSNGEFRKKADILNQIDPSRSTTRFTAIDIDDLSVLEYGDATSVIYHSRQQAEQHGLRWTEDHRVQETYVLQGDEWKLKIYHETLIPPQPTNVKADPASYAEYTGRYEIIPSDVFTVKVAGEKLILQEIGEPQGELKPEGNSTFADPGSSGHIEFARDRNGKVNRMILFPQGLIFTAKRIVR